MKSIQSLLLCLVLCYLTSAEARTLTIVGGGQLEAGTFCQTTGSGDAVCDDFDCAGGSCTTCGDDAASQANCRTDWVKGSCASGTITNQGTGLESGTNYAKTIDAANGASCATTADAATVAIRHVFVRVKYGAVANGSSGNRITTAGLYYSDGNTQLCTLGINGATSKWAVFANGATQADEATGPESGTLYYIWIDFTKGTANTGCKITVSTTSSKGTAFGAGPGYTTLNFDATKFSFVSRQSTTFGTFDSMTVDRVRINTADTAFGDDGL